MNSKTFKRSLAAVMLLMMLAPLIVSTHVAVRSYVEAEQSKPAQEMVQEPEANENE